MRCPDCGYPMDGVVCEKCSTILETLPADFNKNLDTYDSFKFRRFTFKSELDKCINTLNGILLGIKLDNVVNENEISELKNWCEKHKEFLLKSPFNEIVPMIKNVLSKNEIETINDILWVCKNITTSDVFYNDITSSLQLLQGMLHGILSDGIITKDELIGLKNWLNSNSHLKTFYPYDEIYTLVLDLLVEENFPKEKLDYIKLFFSTFIDPSSECIKTTEIDYLKKTYTISGICAIDPEIVFNNRTFCFTGASARTSRKAFAGTIKEIGCTFKDSMSQSIDYLVVGNEGNPCWAFTCYGRKIEQALKLRKDGHKILIVHENDFWDAFNDEFS